MRSSRSGTVIKCQLLPIRYARWKDWGSWLSGTISDGHIVGHVLQIRFSPCQDSRYKLPASTHQVRLLEELGHLIVCERICHAQGPILTNMFKGDT